MQPLVRNALVIEDTDAAVRRVGGEREIAEAKFSGAAFRLRLQTSLVAVTV